MTTRAETATADATGTGLLSRRYRAVTAGIITLVTLTAFEALAVSTAMPVAARELGGLREYGLAFSLTLTTSLFGIVVAGRWADRSGPRLPIVVGLALFAAGLLAAGTATTFTQLMVGRAVSGAGGGLEYVALYVLVAMVYPSKVQPKVFGVISTAWVLPSLVGPTIAGLLTTTVSWRAVFLAVPPVALLALLAMWPRLHRLDAVHAGASEQRAALADDDADAVPMTGRSPWALAGLGAVLAGGAIGLQWGLQEVTSRGWPVVPVVAVCAVAVALSLVRLLPRGTLRASRGIGAVVVSRGLLTAAFYGADTFIPLMLVTQRGWSPTAAGVALTAGAVGWSVGSALQGRSSLPISRPVLLALGGGMVALCVLLLAIGLAAGWPPWTVVVVWSLGGVGMGTGMSTTSVLTLWLSEPGEEGTNTSALQILDALGGVTGIATAQTVFAWRGGAAGGLSVFESIWLGLGVIAAVSVLTGLRTRVPRRPAEESQPSPSPSP